MPEKPHFGPILGPFGQKTPEQDFFSKNRAPSSSMLANTLTLTKKSENSSAQFSRKPPNKWTNRKTEKWTKKGKKPTNIQNVFNRIFISMVQLWNKKLSFMGKHIFWNY